MNQSKNNNNNNNEAECRFGPLFGWQRQQDIHSIIVMITVNKRNNYLACSSGKIIGHINSLPLMFS